MNYNEWIKTPAAGRYNEALNKGDYEAAGFFAFHEGLYYGRKIAAERVTKLIMDGFPTENRNIH